MASERRWKMVWNFTESSQSNYFLFKIDELYIIGGNDGISILTIAEQYDLKDKKIKKLKSMNHARDELAIAIGTDQKIYAIGGFGGPKK